MPVNEQEQKRFGGLTKDVSTSSLAPMKEAQKISANQKAPMSLVAKTKEVNQFYKANPEARPPSALPSRQKKDTPAVTMQKSDDDYSDDNYDNNFDDDDEGEGDKKLAKIRAAMHRENEKARAKAE
jgi:hypothetical protein